MSSNLQSRLVLAYQTFFVLGVSTFTIATIGSLFEFHISTKTFATLIKTSSVLLIVTELLELVACPLPMWRKRLCIPAIVGQAIYFYFAHEKLLFNSGEAYVLASLTYSLSQQLKILAMILEEREFSKILINHKYRFFKFALLAVGSIIFLVSTLIISLSEDKGKGRIYGGMVNCVAGLVFAASIVMLFKKEKYISYKRFEQEMDSPRIMSP